MGKTKLSTEWNAVLSDHQASGLNKTEYCRQHDVDYNQFQYWYRQSKLRATTTGLIPVTVSAVSAPTVHSHCVVEYSHGVRLHIQSNVALAMLPQLLMRPKS